MKKLLALVCICLMVGSLVSESVLGAHRSQSPDVKKSVVLQALEDELQRSFKILTQKGDPPPYFVSYTASDIHRVEVTASLGALQNSQNSHYRLLDVDVRVGGYDLDSSHQIRGENAFFSSRVYSPASYLPVEDDPDAIKSALWLQTDKRYREAVEALIKIKANRAIKVQEEDLSADFSKETPQVAVQPLVSFDVDVAAWEKKAREYSALFARYPEILQGAVTFYAEASNKYLVNSEGTSLQHGRLFGRLGFYAQTKAEDGMNLYRYEAFDTQSLDRLPDEATVLRVIEKMSRDLLALRNAPVVEPYTGPAILSGRASGVFFHEIFGHRIEGHRQKDEDSGQTFTKRVNQSVLPGFLSVYDDPTLKALNNIDLNGFYDFDDEGVKAQRVPIVEQGILKNFLLSRSPIQGFSRSNGHGRKSPGFAPVGRQGNLIVQTRKPVSEAKLREMLISECKKQKKPFGLIFEDISGGFTFTQRDTPQAFQVTPIMVYRVYTDGRPDELVRGVDLIGTPLTSFSKIIAGSDKVEVFNGMCGAESGWVPVSAISPSLLTSQIEVQKKEKSSERLPILPSPRDVTK
ncbi:MAG TPA: TldD/PmbA family protein [Acidobacteriota bacterium]|nr:TldD/PmbA family protein [Acidobacteriota bacterium]HMZ79348.1 TldD/PmbA family protein [Acidobacteriota bacterium]HNB69636.1 TldD/PmbA family protein [Acidobacteriota bacterium]HNG92553.1 TldD/PmbA family protein [Acidobacteriota bacterium]HNH81482.1 TldD/PmbA family protein [Acidobacteriota bacterium]